MEWLEYHRHNELKNLILNTYHLQSEVDSLLREDSQRLAAKLNGIEEILARILSRVEGFGPVVEAIHPGIGLSSQAFEILKLFVESDAAILVIFNGDDGPRYTLRSTSGGGSAPVYRVGEPRFFYDDIRTLHTLGFIIQDYNSQGDAFYRLAREGYSYVQRVIESDSSGESKAS